MRADEAKSIIYEKRVTWADDDARAEKGAECNRMNRFQNFCLSLIASKVNLDAFGVLLNEV